MKNQNTIVYEDGLYRVVLTAAVPGRAYERLSERLVVERRSDKADLMGVFSWQTPLNSESIAEGFRRALYAKVTRP
jgi:hypothetical protein